MVYFALPGFIGDTGDFTGRCARKGLLLGAAGERRIRMVTHVGLDERSVRDAADVIKEALSL
jgi:hypothetical protein